MRLETLQAMVAVLHASQDLALLAVDRIVACALRLRVALAWGGAALIVASLTVQMVLCPPETSVEPRQSDAPVRHEPVEIARPRDLLLDGSFGAESATAPRWLAVPALPRVADPLCVHVSSTVRRAVAAIQARDARCPPHRELLPRLEEAVRLDVGARGAVQVSVAVPF
jgi:hypothetical protein